VFLRGGASTEDLVGQNIDTFHEKQINQVIETCLDFLVIVISKSEKAMSDLINPMLGFSHKLAHNTNLQKKSFPRKKEFFSFMQNSTKLLVKESRVS